MAQVRVGANEFRSGDFPPVCCKTGRPAESMLALGLYDVPGWTWILLLFGILPFFIARWFGTTRFAGRLPITQDVADRARTHRRCIALLIGAAVVFLIAALAGGSPVLAWVGGVSAAVAAVVYMAYVLWVPNGDIDLPSLTIRLFRVHPDFASAVRAGQTTAH